MKADLVAETRLHERNFTYSTPHYLSHTYHALIRPISQHETRDSDSLTEGGGADISIRAGSDIAGILRISTPGRRY